MNTIELILGFVLVLTVMFMAYPKRAKAATTCWTSLMGAMPMAKLIEAISKSFIRSNNKS